MNELLVYTKQSFKQIARALEYYNPSSLTNMLKKYTGLTSTYFKQIKKISWKLSEESRQNKTKVNY